MIKSVSKTLKQRILLWWRNTNHSQKSGGYQPQAAAYLPRRVHVSTAKNSPLVDTWLLSIHHWAHDIFLCYSSWFLACSTQPMWCPPVSPLQGGYMTNNWNWFPETEIRSLLQTTDHPIIQSSLPCHTHSHCLLLGPPLSEESFCSEPPHTLILYWSQIFEPLVSSQTRPNSRTLSILSGLLHCAGLAQMYLCSQIAVTSVTLSHQLAI